MKTPRYRPLVLLILILALASCRQKPYDMLTTIHPDGSCTREFKLEADSMFMVGDSGSLSYELAIRLDKDWKINWRIGDGKLDARFPINQRIYDSIQTRMPWHKNEITGKRYREKPRFQVILSRTFTSMQDMEAHYRIKPSSPWSKLRIRYSLDKQFRWFYTYFTYRETYSKIDLGFPLPIDSFMTADEARFWLTGSPNLLTGKNGIEIRDFTGELEDKYNNWFTKNLWYQQLDVVANHFDLLEAPPVSRDVFIQQKDNIYLFSQQQEHEDDGIEQVLDRFFHTQSFSRLWARNDSVMMTQLDNTGWNLYFRFSLESFNYRLTLPGTVLPTDNAVLKDNVQSGTITADRLLYGDYVIEARSRKSNAWAFIVSGLVVVLAILSLFYKPKRRKITHF